MNISAYNLGIYSSMNSFKGTKVQTAPKMTMGIERELPNPYLYVDCDNFNFPYNKREELIADYRAKIKNIILDAEGKPDKRIIEFLDNQKFEIETASGAKKSMTVKEAINSSIREVHDFNADLFHATGWREIGEDIIRNGFNPEKISRTKLGPGFYFSGSEGGAREYSNCVLRAKCEGKCANVEPSFFEKIASSVVISSLQDFIGLPHDGYSLNNASYELCTKIFNEYARHYLVDELGIDMAYGSSGRFETCFAVYNPKSISSIRFV
ncbi:MAG: hypothetical protein ACI37R_01125 [Candidatus Avigastranaerophilus sp.]